MWQQSSKYTTPVQQAAVSSSANNSPKLKAANLHNAVPYSSNFNVVDITNNSSSSEIFNHHNTHTTIQSIHDGISFPTTPGNSQIGGSQASSTGFYHKDKTSGVPEMLYTQQQQILSGVGTPLYNGQQNDPNVNQILSLMAVSPPEDAELVKTIERVAEYCSNYEDMEEHVRQNNGHEYKFRFLVGGTGSDYFRWVLYCYKNNIDFQSIKPANKIVQNKTGEISTNTFLNSSSQQLVETEAEIEKIALNYEEPPSPVEKFPDELLKEFDGLLASLEHHATAEGIRNARHWVEVNSGDLESLKQMAYTIRKKTEVLSSFSHKLHVLYLVHDVLQNEAVNGETGTTYLDGLKPYLVWILRSVYQHAKSLQDGSITKVETILNLWLERNIIDKKTWSDMHKIMTADNLPTKTRNVESTAGKVSKRRSRFDQGPPNTAFSLSNTPVLPAKVEMGSVSTPPIPGMPTQHINLIEQQQMQQLYTSMPHQVIVPQNMQAMQNMMMAQNMYGNLAGMPVHSTASQLPSLVPPSSLSYGQTNVGNTSAVQPLYQMPVLPTQQLPLMSQNFSTGIAPTTIQQIYGVGILPPPPPPPPGYFNKTSLPTGFDKKPEALALTPETVPVGLMATMLKTLSKRAKNMQTAFVPYKPLDAISTPQILPSMEPPSDYMLDRVEDFYNIVKVIEDTEEWDFGKESRKLYYEKSYNDCSNSNRRSRSVDGSGSRSRSRSRSSSRSRSRSRVRSRSSSRSQGRRRYYRRRNTSSKSSSEWDRPTAWAQAEMGVADDGSVIGATTTLKGERLGLGALSAERQAENDAFEKFRRQRANKYHEHIAQNQASRREPGGLKKLSDTEKLCYICQQPGHLAKDCKYGLS